MGTSLQASPRPKALPPARRLDCAAHSVASIQAVAQRWLATVAGNQVVRRVRAGELDSANPFDCRRAELLVRSDVLATYSLAGSVNALIEPLDGTDLRSPPAPRTASEGFGVTGYRKLGLLLIGAS